MKALAKRALHIFGWLLLLALAFVSGRRVFFENLDSRTFVHVVGQTIIFACAALFVWPWKKKPPTIRLQNILWGIVARVIFSIAMYVMLLSDDARISQILRCFFLNLGKTHPFLTVLIIICVGLLAFLTKETDQLLYGCIEMVFGIYNAYAATQGDHREIEKYALYGAGVYLITEALDNIKRGIVQKKKELANGKSQAGGFSTA